MLKTFADRQPNVNLEVAFMDSEKAYEQVLQGHSDVAVITLALETHQNIYSRRIWRDPAIYLCTRPFASLYCTAQLTRLG